MRWAQERSKERMCVRRDWEEGTQGTERRGFLGGDDGKGVSWEEASPQGEFAPNTSPPYTSIPHNTCLLYVPPPGGGSHGRRCDGWVRGGLEVVCGLSI